MKKLVIIFLCYGFIFQASENRIVKTQFTVPCTSGYVLVIDYIDGTREVRKYSYSYEDIVTFVETKSRQDAQFQPWRHDALLANPWVNDPQERGVAQAYQCYHGDCS